MTIGDTQGFSSIVPIVLSKCFSDGTLTGAWYCYGIPSQIEVSPSWKTEYLNCYITTTRACCKEDSCYENWACRWDIEKEVPSGGYIFKLGRLDIWYYAYSMLFSTVGTVIQNFIKLMRNAGFYFQIDQ